MVVLAQSKEAWYSMEFQAACLEAKYKIESQGLRYTVEDKMRYIEKEVCSVPRFDKECRVLKSKSGEERGFPSWETIVKWEKENPNLPEGVRKRGFLKEFRAQQFTSLDRVPVAPAYFPQPQSYVSGNDVVRQVSGIMCQVLILAMVAWCARQCAEVAMS